MSNLFDEDRRYLLNVYRRMNITIVNGEGSYVYDDLGTRYLDMFSGIAVNNLGHKHPEIINAITTQVNQYMHLSNYFASPSVVNLAKLLVENSFASKVFFTNSGTEANEAAIKVARKYGKMINDDKIELVSFINSFHGRTLGGLSLTGKDQYKEMFKPVLPGVTHIPFNDIEALRANVSDATCGFFLEMIQGEGGINEVSPEFIRELVTLAKQYDFLIIVDDIQAGLGRVGDLFSYEAHGLKPDIVTLAKSLGGGLPLGAMLIDEKLEMVLQPGEHGSTFGGNPVSCAAGEVVLKIISSETFKQDVKSKGDYLIERLNEIKGHFPTIIQDIRGRGLMIGINVGSYADEIKRLGLVKGLLLNSTSNTVIRLLPPLTISYEELNEFINCFIEILRELEE